MGIVTKTTAGMKVAAIAVALVASQSVWAADDVRWSAEGDGRSWEDVNNWRLKNATTHPEAIDFTYAGVDNTAGLAEGDHTITFSSQATIAQHFWNNFTGGTITLKANSSDFGLAPANNNGIYVGDASSGTTVKLVLDTAYLTVKHLYLARQADTTMVVTNAPLTVNGGAAISYIANNVGGTGRAELVVEDGGSLTITGETLIADPLSESVGSLTLNGDATASLASVTVAGRGTGTLTVNDDASVTASGQVYVGRLSGASGVINMNGGSFTAQYVQLAAQTSSGTLNLNGGVFTAKKFQGVDSGYEGTGTINFNGGTLAATETDSVALIPGYDSINVYFGADSVISNDVAATIAKGIDTGSYTLVKKGTGILTFTGAFAGKLGIEDGGVVIAASNLVDNAAGVSIGASARLVIDASDLGVGDKFSLAGVTLPEGEEDVGKFIIVSLGDRTKKATFSEDNTTVTIEADANAEDGIETSWTGAAGDNNWATEGNWSRGVPQDADTAVFAVDSGITAFAGDTIAMLRLENGVVAQIGQFNSENQLTVSSGIAGTGTIVLRGCKLSVAENAEIPATISFRSDNPGTKANHIIGKPVLNGDIDITHDTTHQLRIEATLKGKLLGIGTAYIKGGALLFGDNSDFEGEINLAEKAVTICDPAAGAPKAIWAINQEVGIHYSYATNFNNKAFKMGRMTGSNWFKVPSEITGMTIEVGARDDADMTYMGDFSSTTSTGGNESHEQTNINIVKVGGGVWHNKSAGYASLVVSNGTVRLYTNASNANRASIRKNFTVEVAEGAAIGGTIENTVGRELTSLTFADGAALEAFATTADETTTADCLTATTAMLEGALALKMSSETAAAMPAAEANVLNVGSWGEGSAEFARKAVVDEDGADVPVQGSDSLSWYARLKNLAIQIFMRNSKTPFSIRIR